MSPQGLTCRRLCFRRSGRPVLEEIDVAFGAGQAYLIGGATGAGKSTLLHLLGGLLRPTAGEILSGGEPVSRWPEPRLEVWRRRVGLVFQHLHLLSDLTVLENILLPCIPLNGRGSPWSAACHRLLAGLHLEDLAQIPVGRLSGGQRQRVAVARALIGDPAFFLLDEPTSFQDDPHTQIMLDLIGQAAARGDCVVVCSHDPRLASATVFSQRFALERGRLEVCL